ncbi:hypothetical protein NC99_42210 [Sunxiuqinia dokdonensis]|uniref:Uncharacterized protein n=1 Tax=Sunxiuqinia dokdonensis TaxID=1409788 RepID=A0A0L8V3C9_9BACT|nr:hypothetical protein NC99_42210 [Sunxiuqinia dokdonensis]
MLVSLLVLLRFISLVLFGKNSPLFWEIYPATGTRINALWE